MLDAFRRHSDKAPAAHAEELHALIVASREERAALSTMLTQVQLHAAKLAAAGKASQDAEGRLLAIEARVAVAARQLEAVEQAVGRAHRTLDGAAVDIDGRLARILTQVQVVEHVETRLGALGAQAESIERRIAEASQQLETRQAARAEADERLVADVYRKAAAIAAMLEDVRQKMETIGEHRARVDGVLAAFTTLGGLVLEAQSTLGARQV